MPNYKDITGQRFGKLVAEEYLGNNSSRCAMWRCRCDCGTECIVESISLRQGKKTSCGCVVKIKPIPLEHDLTGQKFNKLSVIGFAYLKEHQRYWKCICDCGGECIVKTSSLRYGSVKSCGCLVKEVAKTRSAEARKTSLRFSEHGHSLYSKWIGIRRRCNDPKSTSYQYYGGRGIFVCE